MRSGGAFSVIRAQSSAFRRPVEFRDRFCLRSIVCEPRAAIPAPNRNCYEIGRDVADAYLANRGS